MPDSGAISVIAATPAAISSAVTDSASPCSTSRLFSELKTATNSAEIVPTTTPMIMPSGMPSTTSATPGSTVRPSASSRFDRRLPVSQGSINAVNTVPSAMQVTPTDAFDSLIAA